jgi:hypothetical protein
MRRAVQITLTEVDRTTLERWSRGRSTQARLVTRARVVLAASEGKDNQDIAAELNISRGAVARWRDRFAAAGIAGIVKDALRGGRPPMERRGLVRGPVDWRTFWRFSSARRSVVMAVGPRSEKEGMTPESLVRKVLGVAKPNNILRKPGWQRNMSAGRSPPGRGPRTSRLYDWLRRMVTQNIVERNSIALLLLSIPAGRPFTRPQGS